MNKINKFRGQAITGEWIYGSLIVFGERTFIYPKNGSQEDYHFYGYEVKPNTVGQFIGRNDENGIEIFTGAIITFCKFDDISLKMIGVVEYDLKTSSFAINCKSKYENMKGEYYFKKDRKYTIVGNIFENPELIEAVN